MKIEPQVHQITWHRLYSEYDKTDKHIIPMIEYTPLIQKAIDFYNKHHNTKEPCSKCKWEATAIGVGSDSPCDGCRTDNFEPKVKKK